MYAYLGTSWSASLLSISQILLWNVVQLDRFLLSISLCAAQRKRKRLDILRNTPFCYKVGSEVDIFQTHGSIRCQFTSSNWLILGYDVYVTPISISWDSATWAVSRQKQSSCEARSAFSSSVCSWPSSPLDYTFRTFIDGWRLSELEILIVRVLDRKTENLNSLTDIHMSNNVLHKWQYTGGHSLLLV